MSPVPSPRNLTEVDKKEMVATTVVVSSETQGSTLYYTFQEPFYVLVKATDWDGDGMMD